MFRYVFWELINVVLSWCLADNGRDNSFIAVSPMDESLMVDLCLLQGKPIFSLFGLTISIIPLSPFAERLFCCLWEELVSVGSAAILSPKGCAIKQLSLRGLFLQAPSANPLLPRPTSATNLQWYLQDYTQGSIPSRELTPLKCKNSPGPNFDLPKFLRSPPGDEWPRF